MIHIKYLNNTILPITLKVNNIILIFIKRRFVNILAKKTRGFVLKKKENIGIIKIYYQNVLLLVIIY